VLDLPSDPSRLPANTLELAFCPRSSGAGIQKRPIFSFAGIATFSLSPSRSPIEKVPKTNRFRDHVDHPGTHSCCSSLDVAPRVVHVTPCREPGSLGAPTGRNSKQVVQSVQTTAALQRPRHRCGVFPESEHIANRCSRSTSLGACSCMARTWWVCPQLHRRLTVLTHASLCRRPFPASLSHLKCLGISWGHTTFGAWCPRASALLHMQSCKGTMGCDWMASVAGRPECGELSSPDSFV
jgi:hypothetical protein